MYTPPGSISRLVAGAAVIAFSCMAASHAHADLTGQQIIDKCKQAYSSLKTYHGKTTVESGDGMPSNSATVQFLRPGKIRVDGTLTGSGTFTFISDGSQTWEKSSLAGGSWKKSESTEMAIAGYTSSECKRQKIHFGYYRDLHGSSY